MQIGIRQRLIFFVFSGLFLTMTLIGGYRYFMEKKAILTNTRTHGEQSGKLMAQLAAPLLITFDYSSLQYLAQNFIHTSDGQGMVVVDAGGKELVRVARPDLPENRIELGPYPISSNGTELGKMKISVYPAELGSRLRAYAVGALIEHAFIFIILAVILSLSVSRAITDPVQELGSALKDVIDRKDFTRRVDAQSNDEIGALAGGVNYLIERVEQFVVNMTAISNRINELSPAISKAVQEIHQEGEAEAATLSELVAAVGKLSASVKSIAESAQALSAGSEETSSAMLEMSASNQEMVRHTGELTSSVEEVTTSVMEMIASIREVAEHVETLSSSAEETAASAIQIQATVREVERAAKESSQLSQQVSVEARDLGVRSIQQITAAMSKIKDSVNIYSELVTRLGKRSEEIGKILAVIVEVTERTNLLALNASILAAQAGEQGRGFAVVAEQIKALADRTAGSAQDIAKLIATVQKETREAVAAMTDSLTAVDEGVSLSAEASAAVNKILASAGRSADTANMIERATAEQSRGIKQVSEAVSNVKQMLSQIAAATQEQSKGTDMILKASEGMRDSARQVHNAILEQEQGGKQIAEAAENVTAGAGKIAGSTREQDQVGSRMLEAVKRVQDLPRRNIGRIESLAAAIGHLEEQGRLLNQELIGMIARTSSGNDGQKT